jgi:hypothetical protein
MTPAYLIPPTGTCARGHGAGRAIGDAEFPGDLLVAAAFGQQTQHVAFADRQRVGERSKRPARFPTADPGEFRNHLRRHRRLEQRLPPGGQPDGFAQLGRRRSL